MRAYFYSIAGLIFWVTILGAQVPVDWPASHPDWWWERNVVDHNEDAGDASPISQGQLLFMAEQGIAELEDKLAPLGGAGFLLPDILNADDPIYLAPSNLGQLKNVSSKFYERFAEVGFIPVNPDSFNAGQFTQIPLIAERVDGSVPGVPVYPWDTNAGSSNLSPALIGQAKYLFSWDFSNFDPLLVNADEDDFPDAWEQQIVDADPNDTISGPRDVYGVAPGDGGIESWDFDGDGVSNLDEFILGLDPTDASSMDADSIPDDWEILHGLDTTPGVDSSANDADADGATDVSEFTNSTDPAYRDHPVLDLIVY